MKDWDSEKSSRGGRRERRRDRSRDKCKEKICFGHWGQPTDPKCDYPCKFEECNFDEIPDGSLYFAEHFDLYGAIRAGAAKQKYSLIGIVLQLSGKASGGKKKPYVLTVMYDQTVKLYPLCDLVNNPLIFSQAVRPRFRSCNKCVDKDINRYLGKVAGRYLSSPFEENSPQIARSIFDIPASNPNDCSYTDTELVYRILFEAALLGDCCPKSEPKEYCIQKCSKFDEKDCSCESDPCSCKPKKPCEKTCCSYDSSSTAECPPCDKVDCYRASAVSICDFLTGEHLDLRWFYTKPIPVYTACLDPCDRSKAVDRAFAQQSRKVVGNIRDLVGCWLANDSFAFWKGNSCSPCGRQSDFCGKEVQKKVCEESSSSKYSCKGKHENPCDQRCDSTICRNAETTAQILLQVVNQLINVNSPGGPSGDEIIFRVVEGNLMIAYFQRVLDFLVSICDEPCERLNFSPASTTYVTYSINGNLLANPFAGMNFNCEKDICEGAKESIRLLKVLVNQLVMPRYPGTSTEPRVIEGNLLVSYFQAILDYLASICKRKASRLTYPSTVQYVSYTVSPLSSPFQPVKPEGCSSETDDSFLLFNKLISKMDTFL